LDITATDIGKECLMDVLTRIPAIRWLSAGQLDAMTDNVMKVNFNFFIKNTERTGNYTIPLVIPVLNNNYKICVLKNNID